MKLLVDVGPEAHFLDPLDIARPRPESDAIQDVGDLLLGVRCGSGLDRRRIDNGGRQENHKHQNNWGNRFAFHSELDRKRGRQV
jgi:hypothetical protein